MKNAKFLIQLASFLIVLSACTPEDGPDRIPIRDSEEVLTEDLVELNAFLSTHFYNYEEFQANPTADLEILFDTIQGVNSSKIPLSQQVETKTIRRGGIDYQYYVLKTRQGDGPKRATFADSALVSYKGYLLNRNVFDGSTNPIWFDMPNVVTGFSAAVAEFNESANVTTRPDGVLSFEGSGVGAVFMPSGIGYFNSSIPGIPLYSPLIFTFKMRVAKETDHDGDGIPSKFEDLDGDMSVTTPGGDNTDGDFFTSDGLRLPLFNYIDADDDDDGLPTRFEITVRDANGNTVLDANGDPLLDRTIDSDGDGIPDYLDNNTLNQQ